ncbi:MAG: hypothetical protein CM1200mP41_14210 [Gammaproteobacteria bacterium]|nr:MAG: hypothetical protein CM1200mP41_14210 [Gammaproteobacteria bacterium]
MNTASVQAVANSSSEVGTKGAISIRNVTKIYDPGGVNVLAVEDCSIEIAPGEVCMIVGPSGCGKTTLLNAIAGFHSITSGQIDLDGQILCGPTKPLADQGADRVVVFQNGALFPWKTLADNVAYGPIVQGTMTKAEAHSKAVECWRRQDYRTLLESILARCHLAWRDGQKSFAR